MTANVDDLKDAGVAGANADTSKTSRPSDPNPTVEVLPGDANDAAHLLVDHHHHHAGFTSSKDDDDEPIWYLAYGSNLCSSVFKGRRKISPLQQRNVFVPGLELVFDLAGLPFVEPRFANACSVTDTSRTQSVLGEDGSVHYDWEEPWTGVGALLGVAYLVTPTDFGKILATEGGGASYKMVAIDAHALSCGAYPGEHGTKTHALTGERLRAFTLIVPPASQRLRPVDGQPSLRYLNLLRSGAEENSLPLPYRAYLDSLRPYQANTLGRKIGRLANQINFYPILFSMFFFARIVALPDGTYPNWLLAFQKVISRTMWFTHDWILKPLFGCGEMSDHVPEPGSTVGLKKKGE